MDGLMRQKFELNFENKIDFEPFVSFVTFPMLRTSRGELPCIAVRKIPNVILQ
jgi:hypothetical protein